MNGQEVFFGKSFIYFIIYSSKVYRSINFHDIEWEYSFFLLVLVLLLDSSNSSSCSCCFWVVKRKSHKSNKLNVQEKNRIFIESTFCYGSILFFCSSLLLHLLLCQINNHNCHRYYIYLYNFPRFFCGTFKYFYLFYDVLYLTLPQFNLLSK